MKGYCVTLLCRKPNCGDTVRELESNCLKMRGLLGYGGISMLYVEWENKGNKCRRKVAMSVYLKCLESGEERRGEKPLAVSLEGNSHQKSLSLKEGATTLAGFILLRPIKNLPFKALALLLTAH